MNGEDAGRPLVAARLIAVLRAPSAEFYSPVIDVVVGTGLSCIELTLTTPGTLADLPSIISRHPDATIGVGTVLTEASARAAIEGGARYLVTPALLPEVVAVGNEAGVPVYGGAFTPTEVLATMRAGAQAVKIFPASAVGPDYLRELRGPFPDASLMPSGGVSIPSIGSWFAAGATAVSIGGDLIRGAFTGDGLEGLEARAYAAVRAAAA